MPIRAMSPIFILLALTATGVGMGLADGVQDQPRAEAPRSPQVALDLLASLIGDWKVQDSDRDLLISFETIANGTVVVETWSTKGQKRSLTVYHLDNDRLMATHYCPQGNQPRLVLQPSQDLDHLSFEFLDATNLSSSEQSHQHSLSFDFSDPKGTVVRGESYRQENEDTASSLVLQRVLE